MDATRKERSPGSQVKATAAERILRTASELFYRRGIRAVGVDAIAAEAGVTKKTLYERFGSKDELVAACLRARDERWRGWLVEGRGGSARERLLSTFDALGEWVELGNTRGCGFVNAVMEQKRWQRGTVIRPTKAVVPRWSHQ